MKKILAVMGALAALSCSVFAFDINVEANLNIPFDVNFASTENEVYYPVIQPSYPDNPDLSDESSKNFGVALGLGGQVGVDLMFNKLLGVGADFSFNGSPVFYQDVILVETKELATGETQHGNGFCYVIDSVNNEENFKQTYFNFNTFVGLAIRPKFGDKFSFVITPGIDMDFTTITEEAEVNALGGTLKGKMTSNVNRFGLGADFRFAFRFNDLIALNVGALVSVQFIETQSNTLEVSGVSEKEQYKFVTPCMGAKLAPRVGASFYF